MIQVHRFMTGVQLLLLLQTEVGLCHSPVATEIMNTLVSLNEAHKPLSLTNLRVKKPAAFNSSVEQNLIV